MVNIQLKSQNTCQNKSDRAILARCIHACKWKIMKFKIKKKQKQNNANAMDNMENIKSRLTDFRHTCVATCAWFSHGYNSSRKKTSSDHLKKCLRSRIIPAPGYEDLQTKIK